MMKMLVALVTGIFAFATVLLDFTPLSAASALVDRTSDAAGVRVVVTPKVLGQAEKVWEFEVVMDTHTKPLNENIAQVAVLVDDAGRRYVPVAWRGDPPGGHHRKGILRFTAPAEMPAAIELQIAGIGSPSARTFRWDLK